MTSRESLPEHRRENDFASSVPIPDYYADAPQARFCSIYAAFAVSRVTKPLTKFYWALSKQPSTLVDTIGPLCDNPSAVTDPYAKLQRIALRSYGLNTHQRTVKWLDLADQGANKPSVLMDQLNLLKPALVEEIQKVLFLQKIVNPRDFQLRENRSQGVGAAAAAVLRSYSPSCGSLRCTSPFRGQRPVAGKSCNHCLLKLGAATVLAIASTTCASDPEPRSARLAAHTRETSRPAPLTPADPLPPTKVPASAKDMSFLPAKNLIFLQDKHNNFRCLDDSGASLSISPHADTAPPMGPHLVGANNTIPAWGFRCFIICFSGKNFEFNFLLAAIATPLLGMDFLTHFGLSIIPSK
jgi:hypothetical protein